MSVHCLFNSTASVLDWSTKLELRLGKILLDAAKLHELWVVGIIFETISGDRTSDHGRRCIPLFLAFPISHTDACEHWFRDVRGVV
jgi:hypothetical protein